MRRRLSLAAILSFLLCMTPAAAFAEQGTQIRIAEGTYRSLSPRELASMLASKDFFLVNVHVPYSGEIPGTDALISYLDTDALIKDYPSDKSSKIVVYCMTGRTAGIALRHLLKQGFTNIYMLDGGMTAWKAAGFQLVGRIHGHGHGGAGPCSCGLKENVP
jgi:rhodanese-related sulfurtransferase